MNSVQVVILGSTHCTDEHTRPRHNSLGTFSLTIYIMAERIIVGSCARLPSQRFGNLQVSCLCCTIRIRLGRVPRPDLLPGIPLRPSGEIKYPRLRSVRRMRDGRKLEQPVQLSREITQGGQKSLVFVRRGKQPRTSSFITVDTCESEDALDKYDAAVLNSSEGGILQSMVEGWRYEKNKFI